MAVDERLQALLEQGEELGCLNLSAVSEFLVEAELDEEQTAGFFEQLEERNITLTDDCARPDAVEGTYVNGDLAVVDHRRAAALPQRGGPLQAADRGRGGRAREADRARRQRRKGSDDQLQPAARRLDREEVPGTRDLAARPDPGRDHRPDPCRREVRLAPRLQVLDLRDLVDPAGGAARRREQVAHDPHSRPHRRARAEDLARGARADDEARAPADRRGDRDENEPVAEARAGGARRRARGHVAGQADRRRGRREASAT